MSDSPPTPANPDDPSERTAPRPISLRAFESLIDQQVRAAEAVGAFNDLPGAGKPLPLDENDGVPDELRTGFRMLKNAGYAPAWIELQKSIREEQTLLDTWLTQTRQRWPRLSQVERERLQAEYAQRLRDLNRQITNYNLTAPPGVSQLPLIQPTL
ncbi:MAG: DUF1992 domain-containing protein [Oscillochloris sp.]|nr:DUF1992 domain-containing protein [Oscillochloris sp.]